MGKETSAKVHGFICRTRVLTSDWGGLEGFRGLFPLRISFVLARRHVLPASYRPTSKLFGGNSLNWFLFLGLHPLKCCLSISYKTHSHICSALFWFLKWVESMYVTGCSLLYSYLHVLDLLLGRLYLGTWWFELNANIGMLTCSQWPW